MPSGIPPGSWGSGPEDDPGLAAALPPGVVDPLLDGDPLGGDPAELGPLADALAALRAAPCAAELDGEQQALAAFRRRKPGARHVARGGGRAGRERRRAARAGVRPAAHRGSGRGTRLLSGQRLAMGAGAAAVVAAIVVGLGYAGGLPGPGRHLAQPPAGRPSAAPAVPQASGAGGGLVGSASPSPQPSQAGQSSRALPASDPAQECLAYFRNPWRPGVASWDKADWDKLQAAAGTAGLVLSYCQPYLKDDQGNFKPGVHVPPGYEGGGRWSPGPGSGGAGGNPGPGGGGAGGAGAGPGSPPR